MKSLTVLGITSLLLYSSCSDKSASEKQADKQSIVDKSLNAIKSGGTTIKNFVVEPDSIKENRRLEYLSSMTKKYPEYHSASQFFNSSSVFVPEKNGTFYKILQQKITDDKSISYKSQNPHEEALYLYNADNNYYIYTFTLKEKSKVQFSDLRRIKKGTFKQPVHDLIFENNRLSNEIFVKDATSDFFDKDGVQYFEIKEKFNDSKIEHLFELGPVQNF